MRTSVTRTSLWHRFELAMVVAAPVLAVLGSGLEPKDTSNSALQVARFAGHRDRYYVGGMLFALAMLLFIPAAHALRGLFAERGARAGAVSRGAMVIGGLSMAIATVMVSTFSWVITSKGVSTSSAVSVVHAANHSVLAGLPFTVGMLLFLGFLGLAGSLLYARSVPWWQPVLLLVGFVCVFVSGNGPAALPLGIPIIAAFGSLAWSLTRREQDTVAPATTRIEHTAGIPSQPSGADAGTPTPV